ncbi:hypothetical protein K1719_016088 [Acacia pycnantha]|nr:hypothetical protein K1719_016088 [Acacia pycnantha]
MESHARMKGDKYINEDVAAVASKIIHLSSRVAKAHSRRYTADILSTAIGKPDYPDAVRGRRGISSTCNHCLP